MAQVIKIISENIPTTLSKMAYALQSPELLWSVQDKTVR